jgi:hypothetical protein
MIYLFNLSEILPPSKIRRRRRRRRRNLVIHEFVVVWGYQESVP